MNFVVENTLSHRQWQQQEELQSLTGVGRDRGRGPARQAAQGRLECGDQCQRGGSCANCPAFGSNRVSGRGLFPFPSGKSVPADRKALLCFTSILKSESLPQSDSEWKKSRFIIDNRRNNIFSHASFSSPIQNLTSQKKFQNFQFVNDSKEEKPYSLTHYQRDLSALPSIIEPNYYPKYIENVFKHDVLRNYKERQNGINYRELKLEVDKLKNKRDKMKTVPFLQNNLNVNEEIFIENEVLGMSTSTETSELSLNDAKDLKWMPKIDTNVLVSVSSAKATESQQKVPTVGLPFYKNSQQRTGIETFRDSELHTGTFDETMRPQTFELGQPTTKSFPLEIFPIQGTLVMGVQLDKSTALLDSNSKLVFETRIETVSSHREIILNPTKAESTSKESNWLTIKNKKTENSASKKVKEIQEPNNNSERFYEEMEKNYEEPEKNYEVDEAVNVMSNKAPDNDETKNKLGYVIEGSNFRRYRVEERTADGFIVGEYGVVRHDDGSLRGVRYTAEGGTNPQLIYDSLIKFLSLR